MGGKFASSVNQVGLIVAWDGAPANGYDAAFHPLMADFQDDMVVVTDMGLHAKHGDPPTRQPCARGTWHVRMVVETVLAMLTRVGHLKTVSHRTWPHLLARLSLTLALFNVVVQWDGVPGDDAGTIQLSIAPFTL